MLWGELSRNADPLQFLRLMALASPELAGFVFVCDGRVETVGADCGPVVHTDAVRTSERAQRAEPAGVALFELPSAQAHIVRLPLVPTRRIARERKSR